MRAWFPAWAIALLLAFATVTIWLRLHIVAVSYEVAQSNKILRNEREALRKAELEAARLMSPSRLEVLARTRFGLSPAKASQVIHLHEGADPK